MHFVQGAANWVIGADDTGVIKGRMKFCRPVFRAIFKVNPDLAISTFRQAQTQFHPIAQSLIAQVRILSSLSACPYLQSIRILGWTWLD
jgi:leukotriene-A4 hydrolase